MLRALLTFESCYASWSQIFSRQRQSLPHRLGSTLAASASELSDTESPDRAFAGVLEGVEDEGRLLGLAAAAEVEGLGRGVCRVDRIIVGYPFIGERFFQHQSIALTSYERTIP